MKPHQVIAYSTFTTSYGWCLVASTDTGICNVLFSDTKDQCVADLHSRWSARDCREQPQPSHAVIQRYFSDPADSHLKKLAVSFDMQGTSFQKKVWKVLASIPSGTVTTYGKIAEMLGDRNLSRAVGTAIGNNPIGYFVPCHRVLRTDGGIGGFRWGIERKKEMLKGEGINI